MSEIPFYVIKTKHSLSTLMHFDWWPKVGGTKESYWQQKGSLFELLTDVGVPLLAPLIVCCLPAWVCWAKLDN